MLCVCWDTSFIRSPAVYDSSLAFTSCLCRVWRSARGESLGPSQIFSNHVLSPGHVHGFLDSQNLWKPFKPIIPQNISSLSSPSSSICLLFAPDFGSSLPHYFCWLHWSFKSSVWFSLLFILQRGIEAQNGEVTFSGSHSKPVAELRLEEGCLIPGPVLFPL